MVILTYNLKFKCNFRNLSFLLCLSWNVRICPLRYTKSNQGWINVIFIYDHTSNDWTINVMEIHSNQIDTLWRSRLWSFLSLFWTWSFSIFSLFTPWSWSSYFSVTFLMHFFIFWITTHTSTNFTSGWWKFSLSDVLRYLANARFIWFRKCFHTIFAAPVSSLKALS